MVSFPKGIYMTYLVRHHIQIEMESVYNMIDRQLHEDEKMENAFLER